MPTARPAHRPPCPPPALRHRAAIVRPNPLLRRAALAATPPHTARHPPARARARTLGAKALRIVAAYARLSAAPHFAAVVDEHVRALVGALGGAQLLAPPALRFSAAASAADGAAAEVAAVEDVWARTRAVAGEISANLAAFAAQQQQQQQQADAKAAMAEAAAMAAARPDAPLSAGDAPARGPTPSLASAPADGGSAGVVAADWVASFPELAE